MMKQVMQVSQACVPSFLSQAKKSASQKKKKPTSASNANASAQVPLEVATPETESDVEQLSGMSDAENASDAEGPKKLFTKTMNLEDKLVAVMVTIFQGSSYDENFREIEPTTVPGERISTYSLLCRDVGLLHDYLSGAQQPPPAPSSWANLLEDLQHVPADSVTFNWECCSGCSDSGFPLCGARRSSTSSIPSRLGRRLRGSLAGQAPSATMNLMGLAVRRGHTVMCSDFSLKALISEWSEEQLGPNPFLKLQQECDQQFQLDFLPQELRHEEVPQQLQVVGELCAERGKAIVAALGGTIVYTVNPTRAPTDLYELKVLTVVSSWTGGADLPEAMQCSVGEGAHAKRGAAGHVTLTYASGGQLVTSMGHWIELTRIDTALESVMEVAARNFGRAEAEQLASEMNGLRSESERRECVQKWSKQMVQKSVPTRMKARTKY
eukprot:TRINITY_DN1970_c0_g2_i1.p1 TRINITY_DN1970_c0_g2~~TRINITY_DN1970_c0_g2_i1.p1  ORF type:complete len:439 (-),score=96.08 TRINITY_DN1970_c0_g2_i1:212-1528(-)